MTAHDKDWWFRMKHNDWRNSLNQPTAARRRPQDLVFTAAKISDRKVWWLPFIVTLDFRRASSSSEACDSIPCLALSIVDLSLVFPVQSYDIQSELPFGPESFQNKTELANMYLSISGDNGKQFCRELVQTLRMKSISILRVWPQQICCLMLQSETELFNPDATNHQFWELDAFAVLNKFSNMFCI
jgi:hypothetical protein